MNNLNDLIIQIELHAVEGINKCFADGISPNDHFNGQPLIYELISEYTRTPRFKDCVKAFVNHGLLLEDKILLAVLLNDAVSLQLLITNDPEAINKKYTLRSAYTPLQEVSLLHICAEFSHIECADVLVNLGADINANAGFDSHGFGGQTPIFHTVNQHGDQYIGMMNFLLSKSADLHVTVRGLVWGKEYPWETFIAAVNPISYAMMGLLPQMHRDHTTIAKIVAILLKHAYGIDYTPKNIPNAYLKND